MSETEAPTSGARSSIAERGGVFLIVGLVRPHLVRLHLAGLHGHLYPEFPGHPLRHSVAHRYGLRPPRFRSACAILIAQPSSSDEWTDILTEIKIETSKLKTRVHSKPASTIRNILMTIDVKEGAGT